MSDVRGYDSASFQRCFSIGNTKMHEEINAGRLKVSRIGRRIFISHDDAMAWLDSLPRRVLPREAGAEVG